MADASGPSQTRAQRNFIICALEMPVDRKLCDERQGPSRYRQVAEKFGLAVSALSKLHLIVVGGCVSQLNLYAALKILLEKTQ